MRQQVSAVLNNVMLAIVAPMATELTGISRAVRDPQSRGITLHVTGIGETATRASVREIARTRPDALILVGFCGGADPDLSTGDLHAAQLHLSPDLSESIAADSGLLSALLSAAKTVGNCVAIDPSATVNTVAGPSAKSRLRASVGAASVNMEDYWAADAARERDIPFASVRAVLDTAGDELPDYIARDGGSMARTIRGLALHPGRARSLMALAQQAQIARRSLTECVLAAINGQSVLQPAFNGVSR